MYIACSKALVCCGHNVLCLDLYFTCSLSDNYVHMYNMGSLSDRGELTVVLLSVDLAVSYSISFILVL